MLFYCIVIIIWVYRLEFKVGLYYVKSTRRLSKVLSAKRKFVTHFFHFVDMTKKSKSNLSDKHDIHLTPNTPNIQSIHLIHIYILKMIKY